MTSEPNTPTETVAENKDSISLQDSLNQLFSYDNQSVKNRKSNPEKQSCHNNKEKFRVSPIDYFTAKGENHSIPLDETSATFQTPITVLLILNQKININPNLFKKIWNSSTLVVCADGGLNRIRTYDENYIPDCVIGDLDSATDENISFYAAKGTNVFLQSSQYYTDFMKSVSLINSSVNFPQIYDDLLAGKLNSADDLEKLESAKNGGSTLEIQQGLKFIQVLVLGGVGGRFDQTIATINQIYNCAIARPHINFSILNPEHSEFILLLKAGVNFINYPRFTPEQELEILGYNTEKSRTGLRNVGVLPILEDAVISTCGLKWDVTNWSSGVKSKVSSSNLQVGEQGFIVTTDKPLFINLEL